MPLQRASIGALVFFLLCPAASVLAAGSAPTPTVVWTQSLTVNSSIENTPSVAVDPAGNVYAAGWTAGTALGSSSSLGIWGYAAKYSPNGSMLWGHVFGNGNQYAMAISGDAAGNALVVTDGGLTKYGPAGNTLWTWNSLQPYCEAVAVDGSGNAYVNGGNYVTAGNDFVVKLTPAGSVAWTSTLNGVGTRPAAIAADAAGDVAIADSNGVAALIACLNPSGRVVWSHSYSAAGSSIYCGGVGIDRSGNVYATINSGAPLFGWGLPAMNNYLVKFGPTGNEVWYSTFGVGSWNSSLALDPAGYEYAVADYGPIMEYDPSGALVGSFLYYDGDTSLAFGGGQLGVATVQFSNNRLGSTLQAVAVPEPATLALIAAAVSSWAIFYCLRRRVSASPCRLPLQVLE